jgi:chemotaxis protein MotA
MFFIIGIVIVFGSVLGGYLPHGTFGVLVQPLEVLIIGGAAVGAFVISNPGANLKRAASHLGRIVKGMPHNKESYVDLLTLMYKTFKLAKTKGNLALEAHIEDPENSDLFQDHPGFLGNHHAVEFMCDYLRLVTMGADGHSEIEDLMNLELDVHHAEDAEAYGAIGAMGEGMPAFGIVAAVLGIIVTMGSITEPPEVLGGLIGAALVGTFLGILLAYGVVTPISKNMELWAAADGKYIECIKTGILAHLQGSAPAVSVEFARKCLFTHDRPTFAELEEAMDS